MTFNARYTAIGKKNRNMLTPVPIFLTNGCRGARLYTSAWGGGNRWVSKEEFACEEHTGSPPFLCPFPLSFLFFLCLECRSPGMTQEVGDRVWSCRKSRRCLGAAASRPSGRMHSGLKIQDTESAPAANAPNDANATNPRSKNTPWASESQRWCRRNASRDMRKQDYRRSRRHRRNCHSAKELAGLLGRPNHAAPPFSPR